MYADYPPNEVFDEEEPFGFALGIRADLMDARGFTYVKYPTKANPALRMGYEAYKDLVARTARPTWTVPATKAVAFSLLKYAFWVDALARFGAVEASYAEITFASCFDKKSPTSWSCMLGALHAPHSDTASYLTGTDLLGNFENTWPLYTLMDNSLENLFYDTSLGAELPHHSPWYISSKHNQPGDRVFG